jgi:hypothetical protein
MMWEEPRPERVPREESTQAKVIIWFVRLLILAGLSAIVFNAIQRQRITAPPPPAATPETRAPAPAPTQPAQDRRPTVAPPSSMPPPTREAPSSRDTPRGDPNVLKTLTDTCRYWTQENTRGQFDGHQQNSCEKMVRYAKEFGMAIPSIVGPNPQHSPTTRGSTSTIRVYVDECERFSYGSINYRQCRASEQRRLTEYCSTLRAQRQVARGATYETLSRSMQAVCSAARRYQVVK